LSRRSNAAHLVEAARIAVSLFIERDAHALQTLQRQRANFRAALANPSVKTTASNPPIDAT
jgi:hypothetical protein